MALACCFFSHNVFASDKDFTLYENNGDVYLKTSPTWVPISSGLFFIIPTYSEGDIVRLANVPSGWNLSNVDISEFSTASPVESTINPTWSDLNQDGLNDVSFTLNNETFQLLTVSSEQYTLNTAPTINALSTKTINEDGTATFSLSLNDSEQNIQDLTYSVTSSNSLLLPASGISVAGTGNEKTVTLTPLANKSGTSTITVTLSDGLLTEEASFVLTVNAVNDTPTITTIANTSIVEDTAGSVSFTIDDVETSSSQLSVTATSSNTGLISQSGIQTTGTGSSRQVTFAPNANANGSANITVTVSDGNKSASRTFTVNVAAVNDTPTITSIGNKSINEDTSGSATFNVNDIETSSGSLSVTATSSNTSVISQSGLQVTGSGSNRQVTFTPLANANGNANVTVTVSDGNKSASRTFTVNVAAVNDTPTISSIGNKSINEDTSGSATFTVNDIETSNGSLSVTATSSNTTVISQSGLQVSGSGSNRQVSYTPVSNANGNANVTVTVSDGNKSASRTFAVNVISVNDVPTISSITPENADEFGEYTEVVARVSASDIDGSIQNVQFRLGAGAWQSDSSAPYTIDFGVLPTGSHVLSFRAEDNQGGLSSVHSRTIQVLDFDWADKGGSVTNQTFEDLTVPSSNFTGPTSGKPSVSGGSASYAIPIAVPPGRANVQPSVSVGYSSRSGDGIAGVGWSLNAVESISRCPKTIAIDDVQGAITFSQSTDRLCLNGQRLINVSGTYGNLNTEYRLEKESFVRVFQRGGNMDSTATYFEVFLPDGTKKEFGNNTESRVSPEGTTVTQTWLINRLEDVTGKNHMTYNYTDYSWGEKLVSSILYTGNGEVDGNRKVQFTYENKGKPRVSYQWGTKTRSSKRLQRIDTYYDEQRVMGYHFTYKTSTASQRDLLASVKECGYLYGELCKDPTTFTWSDAATTWVMEPLAYEDDDETVTITDDSYRLDSVLPRGDVNGDGVRDWKGVYINAEGQLTGTHTIELNTCESTQLTAQRVCVSADFNRDGLTDIWSISSDTMRIGITQTDGTFAYTDTTVFIDSLHVDDQKTYIKSIADYNGDSWPDIMVYEHNAGIPRIRYYEHSGNQAVPYGTGSIIFNYSYQTRESGAIIVTSKIDFLGDLDGNGLPDMLVGTVHGPLTNSTIPQSIPLSLVKTSVTAQGTVFTSQNLGGAIGGGIFSDTGYGYFNMFLDVNGDGLQDMFGWLEPDNDAIGDSAYAPMQVRLNKGNGEFEDVQELNLSLASVDYVAATTIRDRAPFLIRSPKYLSSFKVADIDGDGIPELLTPGTRLVDSCARHNGSTSVCGDNLYRAYASDGANGSLEGLVDTASKDDSIYQYSALKFTQNLDGTISAQYVSTDLIGSASQSQMIDAFGKGLNDFVFAYGPRLATTTIPSDEGTVMESKPFGFYMMRNYGAGSPTSGYKPQDMLESVNNPNGVSANWVYKPLSSNAYDKLDSSGTVEQAYYSPDYDYTGQLEREGGEYLHFASSMYNVAEFNVDNGVGSQNTYQYRYSGAVYNTQGRGFMGFRQITEVNVENTTETHSIFEQKFPKTGLLVQQLKVEVGSDSPFEVITNDWVETEAHTSTTTYMVHNAEQQVQRFDINNLSQLLTTTTTTVEQEDVDEWGNVEEQTTEMVDVYGTHSTTVTSTFTPTDAFPNNLTETTTTVDYDAVSPLDSTLGTSRVSTTKILSRGVNRKPTSVTVSSGSTGLSAAQCTSLTQSQTCVLTTSAYNLYGLPTSVSQQGVVFTGKNDDKSIQTRTVTTTYTNNGTVIASDGYFPFSVTTENGNYDQTETSKVIPEFGIPSEVTDPNNLVTTTSYDSLARPVEVSSPGTSTQFMRYLTPDSNKGSSHVVSMMQTYQVGTPSSKVYLDQMGRTLRTATQAFDASEWIYVDKQHDTLGRTIAESLPHEGTAIYTTYGSYDILGRPGIKITPSTGTGESLTVEYEYDGLTTRIDTSPTDGAALTMYRTYNSAGWLMNTQDANSEYTSYDYDGQGNPLVIEDAAGNQIKASYDNLGRKLWVSDPNQGTTYFTYNAFGELEKEVDANSHYQRYDYDQLGRVTFRMSTHGDASFLWDTDKLGLLTSEFASGVTKEYTYDSFARPIEVTTTIDGASYVVSTEYNSHYGFVDGVSYPNGLKIAFEYSEHGYLVAEKNAATGYVYRQVTAQDAFGNISAATMADGGQQGTYAYSARSGQMLSSVVKVGVTTLHHLNYTNYDSYGNIITQYNHGTGASQYDTFTYDALQRLTKSEVTMGDGTSVGIDYSYDTVGNLLKKTDYSINSNTAYTYNTGTNQVASVVLANNQTANFSYDNKGNQVSRTVGSSSPETFIYNVMNKPTQIQRFNATVNLFYDANWSRYKQVREVDGKTITTHYIDKLYEVEMDGSTTTATSYISDVAVLVEEGSHKTIRFTHRDRLGSATTFLDHNNRVTAYRYYDPFGKPRVGDGSLMREYGMSARLANNLLDSDMATRRGFTDHEHLDEVEIIHMNGRVYDYNLGRFLSVDPIIQGVGNSQGINPYSYVMNNPLAGTDPTGYVILLNLKQTMEFVSWREENKENNTQIALATLDAMNPSMQLMDIGEGFLSDDPVRQLQAFNDSVLLSTGIGVLGKSRRGQRDNGSNANIQANGQANTNNIGSQSSVAKTMSPQQRGRESETRILKKYNLKKNNEKKSAREGNSVPDSITSSSFIEIKDTKTASNTKQMRIQREAAQKEGKEHVVITGKYTKVSKALASQSTIIRDASIGPQYVKGGAVRVTGRIQSNALKRNDRIRK